MTLLDEEILRDLKIAREALSNSDTSVVVVSYGKIWKEKKGKGIRPIIEAIDEMGEDINDSIIGDRILGRASSLLCRYAKAKGVYSPKGTKTGIALLIMGGVPCQVDELIPRIDNKDGNDICPFEKILKEVTSPEEAYKVLKEKLIEFKQNKKV